MIYGDCPEQKLRLRAAEREDLPRFVAWLNDPEVREFLLMNQPMSLAQEQRWFDTMLERPQVEQVLVIEIMDGEAWTPIGNTSFMSVNWASRSAEIGIFIGEKSHWNQGYGRETMRTMLRYGFDTLNLNRIFLHVFEDNFRGIKAYEHVGFIHEGRLRQAEYKNGKYSDILIMSVLKEEWDKRS